MKRKYPYQDLELKDLKGEVWKDIPSLDGAYEISNFGRIKSLRRYVHYPNNSGFWKPERILKARVCKQITTNGNRTLLQLAISISLQRKNTTVSIARMVYYLFVNQFDLNDLTRVVSMKDENSLNIRPDNLMLVSPAANITKAYEKERRKRESFGNRARVISQYDFNGNWIASHLSISSASRATGISARNIAHSLDDKKSYASGYIWRFGTGRKKLNKIPARAAARLASDQFHSTPVTQYDRSGKRLKEYENLKAAARAVNAQPNLIRRAILGNVLTAKNCYWKLGKGKQKIAVDALEKKKRESTKAIWRTLTQYDLTGKKISSYESLAAASRATAVPTKNISSAVRNERISTSGGFIWKYGDGEDQIKIPAKLKRINELNELYDRPVTQYNKEGIRVKVYQTLRSAAESNLLDKSRLVQVVTGKALSYKGYCWRLGQGPEKIQAESL